MAVTVLTTKAVVMYLLMAVVVALGALLQAWYWGRL